MRTQLNATPRCEGPAQLLLLLPLLLHRQMMAVGLEHVWRGGCMALHPLVPPVVQDVP